jgi:hypothetical protein
VLAVPVPSKYVPNANWKHGGFVLATSSAIFRAALGSDSLKLITRTANSLAASISVEEQPLAEAKFSPAPKPSLAPKLSPTLKASPSPAMNTLNNDLRISPSPKLAHSSKNIRAKVPISDYFSPIQGNSA